MNASKFNFVTANEILADVLKLVRDADFKLLSRGYYISQIQQALEELAFDTYFDEKHEAFDIPENFRIEMPKGMFNIKNMYLFNGDICDIASSTPVWYKANFINGKSGSGYVANNKGNNTDPFTRRLGVDPMLNSGLYYYAIQNGEIMLSSNCGNYQKLFVHYNGTGGDVGEVPFIPLFLRQAVKDYVTVNALEVRIAESELSEMSRWSNLLSYHKNNLEEHYDGSWAKAEKRVRKLDMKERKDIKEYMQKMYY